MQEGDLPNWRKTIDLRAILLGAIIFIVATTIGTVYLQGEAIRGDPRPYDEQIIIPKG